MTHGPTLRLALLLMVVAAVPAPAQEGITRTELVRSDLGETGREVIQVRVELAPGIKFPAHSHPGDEVAYVVEGVFLYRLGDGRAVTVRAGESLFIPAGVVHTAENVGDVTAVELATYVVAKDKPLVALHVDGAAAN